MDDDAKVKEFDRVLSLLHDLKCKETVNNNMFFTVCVYLVCEFSILHNLEKNEFIKKISNTYDLIKDYYES